ncbi:hypothetical protein [Zhongshania aliphaticivorans]|uniref:hypothetical protein n=1 Tax=Zhongshania aliphaticivorans TaxID=1470434 RepID=UPI0012E6D380|nr:hypothetical protein [Zhongshania aliphaticivorans]CAA0099773.1 Uncharacterised protein [Zhongshania aliphaticivorans]
MNCVTKFLYCSSIVLLTACGGGSSSGDSSEPGGNNNPVITKTGVFIDAPVAGLDFSTPTKSGKTNSNGEFEYVEGEKITFTLFGQAFDAVDGSSIITPFDFIEDNDNQDKAINIVRTLMAADTDGDLTTINLPDVTATLNFNQSADDFGNDADVNSFVQLNSNGGLPTVAQATAHVEISFAGEEFDGSEKDLAGTEVYARIKSSRCPDADLYATYSFSNGSVTIVGPESVDDFCVVQNQNQVLSVANFMSRPGNPLRCGDTECSFAELNRTYEDGEYSITIKHPMGSEYATAFVNNAGVTSYYMAFEDYRVELAGEKADMVITASYCTEDDAAGYVLTFRENDFVQVGTDTIHAGTCEQGRSETNTYTYAQQSTEGDSSFPCPGFPSCTAKDLNRYDSGVDRDNRQFTMTRLHYPGSNSFSNEATKAGTVWKTTVTIRD